MNNYTVSELTKKEPYLCSCGKIHKAHLRDAVIEKNAVTRLPEYIKKYNGRRIFAVADENTRLAGASVFQILAENKIPYTLHSVGSGRAEPDEKAIGSITLHFDYTCDMILGVGTGVINDLCKILAKQTGLPYILVPTAPSMDGLASSTSSVIRDGLKVSVDSKCPEVIIADTEILRNSPQEMILAGFGDMLAKYVSVCEWRIGHIVTGEYYCEDVAEMMRSALRTIIANKDGLVNRDERSIIAVTEGLILSGIAADYAGVSRPASGVEHYYSHLWDMRHLEFDTPWSLHGIQCGIGTNLALRRYSQLLKITPDKETANENFASFDIDKRKVQLRDFLGSAAKPIIDGLSSSDRYNSEKHRERLDKIIQHWDEILNIIRTELPTHQQIEDMLKQLNAPYKPSDIGLPDEIEEQTFRLTADIRDKYILSTLLHDLGM